MVLHLRQGHSPGQVSGTLKRVDKGQPSLQVPHETIDGAIHLMPRGGLRTEAVGRLRFGHAKRRPRSRGEDRRGQVPGGVGIHDRPPEVEGRLIPGHWGGDLTKGKGNRPTVGTIVERTTLFTVLAKMENARAESALQALAMSLTVLAPSSACRWPMLWPRQGNGGTCQVD